MVMQWLCESGRSHMDRIRPAIRKCEDLHEDKPHAGNPGGNAGARYAHSWGGNNKMAASSAAVGARSGQIVTKQEERKVIFASSLGTVFEWYDFYLYAVLAPFFAALFFPPGNDTAALLSAFATYAAGFLVRPFGALVFGRIGDLVGRKYTFLVTILVMGASTFAVGLLPTYSSDRLACADPARVAAAAAGPGAGRRIRRCRDLRRRACAGQRARLCHEPGSRPRRRSACSWRCWSSAICRSVYDAATFSELGLAPAIPRVAGPAGVLGLHPAEAE